MSYIYFVAVGSFYKYSAIEILAGGLKRNDRNETADSLVACAGKCNAAFLESARFSIFINLCQFNFKLVMFATFIN